LRKILKSGQKSGNGGSRLGGFTSTPRAGALSTARGVSETPLRGGVARGLQERPRSGPRAPGYRGPCPAGDRAPARGVDVKPPSRGWLPRPPGPGSLLDQVRGLPRPLPRAGAGDPRSRDPSPWEPSPVSGALRGPRWPSGPSRAARRGLFYINPSRRGPAPRRRGVPRDGVEGEGPSPPDGVSGAGRPAGTEVMV